MLCSEQGCSDAAGCSTRKHFVKCLSFSACLILIALLVLVYSEAFNCCQIILSPLSHNSLYIAVVKTLWPKAFEGERVSLYLYILHIQLPLREAKAGTEAMKEHCLLAWSPWLARFTFLYIQDHPPRGGATTVGWALPINHSSEKCPMS